MDTQPNQPQNTPEGYGPQAPKGPLRFIRALLPIDPSKPIHEDHFVRVVIPKGWGMQEMRVGKDVKADISPVGFNDRETHQGRMKQYFDYALHIFQHDPKPHLPQAPWLREARKYVVGYLSVGTLAVLALIAFFAFYLQQPWMIVAATAAALGGVAAFAFFSNLLLRFRDKARWPGFMEEREMGSIEHKFPGTDDYVRRVIDRYTDLFLDNNWMFNRLKRFFQFVTIIGFYVAVAPLAYLLLVLHTTDTAPLLAAAGWLVVVAILSLVGFFALNDHIYEDKYFQSLQNSAQDVSNVIRDRMSAINRQYQQTYAHLTELQATGEAYDGKVNPSIQQVADADLAGHMAFYDTQLLFWLGKRLEYIELYLYNRIHSALTIHAALTVAGFVSCLVIFLLGLLPALLLFGLASMQSFQAFQAGSLSSHPFALGSMALSALLIALIALISHRSYYKQEWNSLKSTDGASTTILESQFDTKNIEGWQTFRRLRLDNNLAGRIQRAMVTIHSYFEKMGRTG